MVDSAERAHSARCPVSVETRGIDTRLHVTARTSDFCDPATRSIRNSSKFYHAIQGIQQKDAIVAKGGSLFKLR